MKRIFSLSIPILFLLALYGIAPGAADLIGGELDSRILLNQITRILLILIVAYLVILVIYLILRRTQKPDATGTKGSSGDRRVADINRPRTKKNNFRDSNLEQERWDLPGFLSLMPVVSDSRDIRFDTDLFSGSSGESGESLFNFRLYSFSELPENFSVLTDVEAYCRHLLESVSSWGFDEERATLYLLNRNGEFRSVLQRKGHVFVSGDVLEPWLPEEIRGRLTGEVPVSNEDGTVLYFPLSACVGILGALRVDSLTPMFSKEKINTAWNHMRKYGEFLYQARAYEQFTTDPESTLNNGMRFRNDLRDAFNRRDGMVHSPVLILIQFNDSCDGGIMSVRGMTLRNILGSTFKLYRIAKDVFALISSDPGSDVLLNCMRRYELALELLGHSSIRTGAAVVSPDVTDVDSWFRYAGLSLEEARLNGHLIVVRTETGSIDVPGVKRMAGG